MEGITHGIRAGGSRKVTIKVPQEPAKPEVTSKDLRIQAKYGVVPMADKPKEEEKKSMSNFYVVAGICEHC